MNRKTNLLLAVALTVAAVAGRAGYAHAMMQTDTSAELRATGQVGEQANGYLGIVESAPSEIRARVNAVNIRRRAAYTELAGKRRVQIEEVAATMACELLATSVAPGQYYRLADGEWRQRQGNAPVRRPAYCI
ncbi:MAG: YdbL family protein [Sphingosinicella sp.]|nr:YdbL family protein [Sphingosinicella sp.]